MKNKNTKQTEVVANKGKAAKGHYEKVDKSADKSTPANKEDAAKKHAHRAK